MKERAAMSERKLQGLEPESVFRYFEEICAIPHGSRNTKAISDYLVSFAKAHGLRYRQDESNNVVIFAPGTCGLEDHESVILQGHMDMVCEKDAGCPLDMAVDGLDVTHDGCCIFAKGTTLGGDDGIAVAYALAILDDNTIAHPPLEVIITVDEEIGMLGAAAMDLADVKGRTMLNLDSEDEGIFTVSCAGGATCTVSLNAERKAVYGPCVRLSVEGLRGGHSGAEIHKNRANANKVMGDFLGRIQKLMPLCLTSFSGGSKDNAIPRACQATVVAMGIGLERINDIAAQLQQEVRETYDEPEALVQAFDVDALGGNALTTAATADVISLLCAAPNGVQAYCPDMPELVQTSLNLGIAKLGDRFTATFSVRSSVNAEKEGLITKLKELADFYNGTYSQSGTYPAWEFKKDSRLRDVMVPIYTRMFGKEPKVLAIHAGLECGLLGDKLPGLDCVSIGPQMHDIHTSREKLEIASTKRTWDFLLEVLKAL
jgi:dipeptidase D